MSLRRRPEIHRTDRWNSSQPWGRAVHTKHPPTVLIAEATDDFRRHLAECLAEPARYEVLEAADELDVRRILDTREGALDVVVLSLFGFKQKGLQILRLIKSARPEVEVILLTPSEDHSLALSMEGMRLGAFDDLLIPFDVDVLTTRVREALERRRRESKPVPGEGTGADGCGKS